MSKPYICKTCGVQYTETENAPLACRICEDERQYVSPTGQEWTDLEELSGLYDNEILQEEVGLFSITTKPKFAIGQTAYIVQTDHFNLMWDCITYIDQDTIQNIKELGGIDAIALSHPHYYSTMIEWAEFFDVHVYVHEDDKKWVTRPSERIIYWSGENFKISEELTLHKLGGHFEGGSILHWSKSHDGKGILLSGDIIQVVADPKWVSFMYSYPNLIPLSATKVKSIAERVEPLNFERLYNAFHNIVQENANERVQLSAKRYIEALQ